MAGRDEIVEIVRQVLYGPGSLAVVYDLEATGPSSWAILALPNPSSIPSDRCTRTFGPSAGAQWMILVLLHTSFPSNSNLARTAYERQGEDQEYASYGYGCDSGQEPGQGGYLCGTSKTIILEHFGSLGCLWGR